ncbi:uncharacterized protein LOC115964859 [Quercus lobata]|uniref:uncharacterized protein LOC115964859 n=1 Tax=Quercus lobata TaxID=97700 RepID=UPI001245AD45|nr:uncharacterized protein LOC115964859 [Quercus lobata]
MSEGRLGGQVESGSIGSSQDSTWGERRQKRHKDRERERREEESCLGEGLDQTQRTMLGASGHGQCDERDQELERLCRLVRDLELEARGWRQRRDRGNQERRNDSAGNRSEERSSQSGSRQCQDRSLSRETRRRRNCLLSQESRQHRNCSRSHGYDDRGSDSPKE